MMSERYLRNNLKEFEQEKLKDARVLIAGLGGLGSGVLAALAGLGVGSLHLLDRDVVELSNLNRQFIHRTCDLGISKVQSAVRWTYEFNPEITTIPYEISLSKDNSPDFGVDVIVDCFDNYPSKFLLNSIAQKQGIPLVHGGVDSFFGQVTTIVPSKTPCLMCFLGDNRNALSVVPMSLAPVVNLVASIQAAETFKLLLGRKDTLRGKLLRVDISSNYFKVSNISKNPNCCT